MIKFYNTISKYIREENSLTKFKHKLQNLLITKVYYLIKELSKEYKLNDFKYEDVWLAKRRLYSYKSNLILFKLKNIELVR